MKPTRTEVHRNVPPQRRCSTRRRLSGVTLATVSMLVAIHQCIIPSHAKSNIRTVLSESSSRGAAVRSSGNHPEDPHHLRQRTIDLLDRDETVPIAEGFNSQAEDSPILRLLEATRKRDADRSQYRPGAGALGTSGTTRKLEDDSSTVEPEAVEEPIPLAEAVEEEIVEEDDSTEAVSLGISSAGKGGKGDKKSSKKESSTKKNSKSSKKSKSSGKGGKGDGNIFTGNDDDSVGGDDDDDDDDDDDGGGGAYPNPSPTLPPSGGGGNEPTDTGGVPTAPVAPVETPPSNREPPTPPPVDMPPTEPPAVPRCQLGADGLFGSQVGLSQELEFAYQMQVIPSVTVSEINLNVLPSIETAIGERVVEQVFDQCSSGSSSAQKRSSTNRNKPNQDSSHNGKRNRNGEHLRQLRALQSVELGGFSTRPRDTVVEGVECVNVEQVYPCFVIRGRVTAYTEQPITDATLQKLNAALELAIEEDGLENADTRVIAVSWRDSVADPLPGGDTDGGDDGNNGGGDNNGGDGNNGGGDSPTPSPVAGGTTPVIRENEDQQGLETWAIALISVGGVLLLCMGYLCFRRQSHAPIFDDDDEDDGAASDSSDDEFRDEPGSKKEHAPLVTSVYEPPQPQQIQQSEPPEQPEQPRTDPYRDPYNVNSQYKDASQVSRASAAGSEGTPIEEQSDSDEEDSQGEEEYGAIQSFEQNSQPPGTGRPTAEDNPIVSPYGRSQDNENNAQWDQNNFNKTAAPPMESTSEEFSSEYSEEEVDEEYEIEYVEDEEGLEGVVEEYDDEGDDDEDESYSDDEDDDDYDDEEEIVEDEPGKTPILPWLAQDDE